MRIKALVVSINAHLWLCVGTASANNPVSLIDADTISVAGVEYRLDGIDAPENDQVCINANRETYFCGGEARKALINYIDGRPVLCLDKGPDSVYPQRRIGECSVEGKNETINRWLVQQGLAINFEPYAKGRFMAAQLQAKNARRGIWAGCFVNPQQLRHWEKTKAALLGPVCGQEDREQLFPDHPNMPPGCSIKGTTPARARAEGYRGIYHTEGCRSYRQTTNPKRWFCSESDAVAAGFRKAQTCR
jgi:endonuclease YncB( thermonuclease family)